jgi:hypothetical protein
MSKGRKLVLLLSQVAYEVGYAEAEGVSEPDFSSREHAENALTEYIEALEGGSGEHKKSENAKKFGLNKSFLDKQKQRVRKGNLKKMGARECCHECAKPGDVPLRTRVLRSNAGYYVGKMCDGCGPYERASGYFPTQELAEQHLRTSQRY